MRWRRRRQRKGSDKANDDNKNDDREAKLSPNKDEHLHCIDQDTIKPKFHYFNLSLSDKAKAKRYGEKKIDIETFRKLVLRKLSSSKQAQSSPKSY